MFNRFLDGYCNPENELFNHVCKKAFEGLTREEKEKDRITDTADWLKKASAIRKSFLESIGGLNFEKTDLKPDFKGDIDKGEYIIRKVVFQSLPDFYVTANLYIPKNIKKPAPGILFSCGHSKPAKAEPRYQLAAIELALNRMVVLVVDPPGQGETIQMPERHDIDWGVKEHSYIGLTCTLAGMNIAKYFVWNLVRSIDFLCSLEYVDENKIGATGNSGGGTQTSYISLVDDRIKAAAPGCYINGRKQYITRGHAHDSEQNIFGCMNFGLDYGEFISCFAPKPFRLLCQQYDFFPIEGSHYSFERAKRVYSLFNAEYNADMFMGKDMHGLSDELRFGLVEFFTYCFADSKPKTVDPYPYLESEDNLLCTKTGCVFGEIKGARPLDAIVPEEYIKTKKRDGTPEKRLKEVFSIDGIGKRPLEKRINPMDFNGYKAEKVFWLNQEQITNAGIYIHGFETKKVNYILFENGTEEIKSMEMEILKNLEEGDVFVLDLSGMGSVKPAKINNGPFYGMYGTIHKICNDLLMTGSSLMELWIKDILIAEKLTDKEIIITAYGKLQPASIIAVFMSKLVKRLILRGDSVDWEKIMKCRAGFTPELEVFGFSKYLDIDEILVSLTEQGKI